MAAAISRREMLAGLGASGLLLPRASAINNARPRRAGGDRALQDI